MSLHIRNCLSQIGTNTKEDYKFRPFSKERNQLGKIIKKNCFKKVISSEDILQSLKMSSEQYFLIKRIQKFEQRYVNWKKQSMTLTNYQWNEETQQKSLSKLRDNIKFYRSKQKSSFHDQVKQTINKINSFRSTIIENRKRIKNKIRQTVSPRKTNIKPQCFNVPVPQQINQSMSKTFSSNFRRSKISQKRSKTYDIEQYHIFAGKTLYQKKFKRPLFGKIPSNQNDAC